MCIRDRPYSRAYYRLRAQKRRITSEIKQVLKKKTIDKALVTNLKRKRRAVIRAATRRKKAESIKDDAKNHYFSQKAFNKNPHRFSQRLFKEQTKIEPEFDEEICESHFRKTYADENRNYTYKGPRGLKRPPEPKRPYGTVTPSRATFDRILKRRPNKSAPGPNGLPYIVYKKLRCCAGLLYQIIRRITQEEKVPTCYGLTVISLTPKDPTNAKDVKLFRPIACMNVESKIR